MSSAGGVEISTIEDLEEATIWLYLSFSEELLPLPPDNKSKSKEHDVKETLRTDRQVTNRNFFFITNIFRNIIVSISGQKEKLPLAYTSRL